MSQSSVTTDIRATNADLKNKLAESESWVKGWAGRVTSVFTGTLGADLFRNALGSLKTFLGESLTAWAEQEEASARLGAVLESTGHAAGFSQAQLEAYASKLQELTKFSDDAVISAEAVLATFTNVRGDTFLEATKAAADMATVMGTDLQGAIVQVGKALQSPIEGVTALQRVGVKLTDAQEAQIKAFIKQNDIISAQKVILAELTREFGGAAEKVGGTFAGSLAKLANRWGEVKEAVGKALVPLLELAGPVLDKVLTAVENVTPVIAKLFGDLKKKLEESAPAVQEFFNKFKDTLLAIGAFIKTVVMSAGDAFKFLWYSLLFQLEKFGNDWNHFWTDYLPRAFPVLIENVTGLFIELGRLQRTFFLWAIDNAFAFGQNFVNAMARGMKESAAFDILMRLVDPTGIGRAAIENLASESDKPLTEFKFKWEATWKELPKIAARALTPLEQQLKTLRDFSFDRLSKAFGMNFDEMKKSTDSFLAWVFQKVKTPAVDMKDNAAKADVEAPAEKKKKEAKDKQEKAKTESTVGTVEGLEEMHRRIQAAAMKAPEEAAWVKAIRDNNAWLAKLIDALQGNHKAAKEVINQAAAFIPEAAANAARAAERALVQFAFNPEGRGKAEKEKAEKVVGQALAAGDTVRHGIGQALDASGEFIRGKIVNVWRYGLDGLNFRIPAQNPLEKGWDFSDFSKRMRSIFNLTALNSLENLDYSLLPDRVKRRFKAAESVGNVDFGTMNGVSAQGAWQKIIELLQGIHDSSMGTVENTDAVKRNIEYVGTLS